MPPLLCFISELSHKLSREAQSTEEVLRAIEEANHKLKEENIKEIAIGSMDVKALYPSLDIEASAKVVAEHNHTLFHLPLLYFQFVNTSMYFSLLLY